MALEQVVSDYKSNDDDDKQQMKLNWKELKIKMKAGDIGFYRDFLNENMNSLEVNISDPKNDNTLLMYAAEMGQYNIAHLLIQYNADINIINKHSKKTALSYAQQYGYYNIAVLIEFSRIGASLGAQVKDKIDTINRQDGIINNMLNKMDINTINDITAHLIDSIANKLAFSDDILNLCWASLYKILGIHPLQSQLYKTLIATYSDIVCDTANKRDWQWLNDYFISSTIWFRRYSFYSNGEELLFNQLLRIIEIETLKQCQNSLKDQIEDMKTNQSSIWKELIHFEYKSEDEPIPRQDSIEHGLECEYTKKELLLLKPKQSAFDTVHFYDLNNYLDALIIRANEVQDYFENDMNVIVSQFKSELNDTNIFYKKGPLKKVKRCIEKTESDYFNAEYPTSAQLLDINRCSITFTSPRTMINALKLLIVNINDAEHNRTCIINIVRCKNGWQSFLNEKDIKYQYNDIKVNVVIQSPRTKQAIIGEIQFTLDFMVQFKTSKSHALYSVERLSEFTDNFKAISPFLMDKNKQLFTLAINGDTKGISKYMINNNIKSDELLNIVNDKNQTVLAPICEFNHVKALKLVIHNYSNNETLIKALQTGDTFVGDTPINYALKKNAKNVIQLLIARYPTIMMNYNDSLHYAMMFDDVAYLEQYLSQISAVEKRINIKMKNESPFLTASKYGSIHCIKALFDWINNTKNDGLLKSILLFKNKSGDIPLTFLCLHQHMECMQLVLERTKQINATLIREMIWHQNNVGNTVFMKSVAKNQLKSAECVFNWIDTKEDKIKYLKLQNKRNETVQQIAIRRNNSELAEMINGWMIELSK
eukprot:55563_1